MDKRQDIIFKDQELAKMCRCINNAIGMLDDASLSANMRAELLSRVSDLTRDKASLTLARDNMLAELHEADQRMLSERTARHREEDFKGDRENKMQKSDGSRGGHSNRGGRGGGRFY